jgi:hypothetical protein
VVFFCVAHQHAPPPPPPRILFRLLAFPVSTVVTRFAKADLVTGLGPSYIITQQGGCCACAAALRTMLHHP